MCWSAQLQLNLGCGRDYRPGWINVDCREDHNPDIVFDLEKTPWPLESNCADIILLKYVLEYIGKETSIFLNVMSEIYRISKPDAIIEIYMTHPMHIDFLKDPMRIRPIVPETFQCFDLALVEQWQAANLENSPLAKNIEVDFETIDIKYFLDKYWSELLNLGEINKDILEKNARSSINVIHRMRVLLKGRKPFRHGRSLDRVGAICLERHGGLGDVLMLLGAAKALKSLTGKPIYALTSEPFRVVMESCPYLDGVITQPKNFADLEKIFQNNGGVRRVDFGPVKFGLSRRHQIDAYLEQFGLMASPEQKEIVLDIDVGKCEADTFLAALPPCRADRKRILVHPAQGDPNRTWPYRKWVELCERLSHHGHQVILIGSSTYISGKSIYIFDIPNVFNAVNKLSINGTLSLMDQSDVLISTDGGPVQLAGATYIHIIGIYTVVDGRNRLPFRRGMAGWGSTSLKSNCSYSPCYQWMGEDDISRVKISGLNFLFSEWCLASEKYDCLIREISVDDVFNAFCEATWSAPE